MNLIYVIEDEPIMADCIASAIKGVAEEPSEIAVFNDGVSAMAAINEKLPDVILLDVLLTGPDGFALLNEMLSYHDTAKIPVVLISSLDLAGRDLSHYGVKQILDKTKMTPEDIYAAIKAALNAPAETFAETPATRPLSQETSPVSSVSPEPSVATPTTVAASPTQTPPQPNAPINLNDFKERLAASAQDPHAQ